MGPAAGCDDSDRSGTTGHNDTGGGLRGKDIRGIAAVNDCSIGALWAACERW